MALRGKSNGNHSPAAAARRTQMRQMMDEENKLRIFNDEIALAYPPIAAEQGKEFEAVIYGGDDWCDFYVRPRDVNEEMYSAIQTGMDKVYSRENVPSLKMLGLWTQGQPCVVRYARDRKWYRARLEDTSYGLVRFVDYGNVQRCPENEVKPLTRSFAEVAPPACLRCTLTERQTSALLPYDSSTCRIRMIIVGSSEPYEVELCTDRQNNSNVPEEIEMVMENVLNEMKQDKMRASAAERVASAFLLDLDSVATTSFFEMVPLEPVATWSDDRNCTANLCTSTSSAAGEDNAQVSESIGVQAEGDDAPEDETESEEMNQLRGAAAEDAQKLRCEEKDLVMMMKLVGELGDNRRRLFFELLERAYE